MKTVKFEVERLDENSFEDNEHQEDGPQEADLAT